MTTARMSQGQMGAALGGGVVLIIALFLSWESGAGDAFQIFSGMDIIMLLVAVAAIVWAGSSTMNTGVAAPPFAGRVIGVLGVLVMGWALGWDLEAGSAGLGAWLALAASIAIAWAGLDGGASRMLATSSTGAAVPPSPAAGPSRPTRPPSPAMPPPGAAVPPSPPVGPVDPPAGPGI